jgi:hypothetical protein
MKRTDAFPEVYVYNTIVSVYERNLIAASQTIIEESKTIVNRYS